MAAYRIRSEADSHSNRRSRTWTIEAATEDDAVFEARVRHTQLVGGNHSVWIVSVDRQPEGGTRRTSNTADALAAAEVHTDHQR